MFEVLAGIFVWKITNVFLSVKFKLVTQNYICECVYSCICVFVYLCICVFARVCVVLGYGHIRVFVHLCICVFARVCVALGYGHDLLSTSPMVSTSACTEPLTDTVARRD